MLLRYCKASTSKVQCRQGFILNGHYTYVSMPTLLLVEGKIG